MPPVPLSDAVQGQGPPLLILHGLFGSGRNWATVAKRLADRFEVHAVDLRNHGGSPWTPEMDYPSMADDLKAMLDGLGRSSILGHSMGGKAAMALALLHPELVDRLIVVDIAPIPYAHDTHPRYIEAMRQVDLSGIRRRAEVEERLRDAIPDNPIRLFLLQNLESDGDGYRWRLNLDALAANIDAIMGFPGEVEGRRFTGPTLFLAGEKSHYLRPEAHERIRALFPAAEIAGIPGAGHWPHAEQPDRFIAQVRNFLDR